MSTSETPQPSPGAGPTISRRQFVKRAAIVGAGAAFAPGLLAACTADQPTMTPVPPRATGATPTPTPTPVSSMNPLYAGGQITRTDVAIEADGFMLRGYLARPAERFAAPGVLVVHENRGLVPYVRDVVDGLASSGYVALAPDLLSREGGTAVVENAPSALRGIDQSRHVEDMLTAMAWLQDRSDVGSVGAIGFCFGGAVVWRLATAAPDLALAVPYYGSNPPLEDVPNIQAAIFAVYGDLDERINARREELRMVLVREDIDHLMKTYPNAQHAFHNHTGDRYNPTQAARAWADTLNRLREYLG